MTAQKYEKPKLQTHSRVTWHRIARNWPLLVWIGVIVATAYMYSQSSQFGGMTGSVEIFAEPIAPLDTAKLVSVDVKPGQRVKAGDVLAHLDTSTLDASLSVEKAGMAEAEDSFAIYQQDLQKTVYDFEKAIKDAQATLESERIQFMADSAELAELKKEQARRNEMFKRGIINAELQAMLRPQIASLESSVVTYPELIRIYSNRVNEAVSSYETARQWLPTEGNETLYQALERIKVSRLKIFDDTRRMLEIQRESYILKASRGGIVSRTWFLPGDVVPAGAPILKVVSETSDYVVGFLPELFLTEMKAGDEVTVWRQTGHSRRFKGVVEAVEPEVDILPGRVSVIRGEPVRGRRVSIHLTEAHDLIPGETVRVRKTVMSWLKLLQ